MNKFSAHTLFISIAILATGILVAGAILSTRETNFNQLMAITKSTGQNQANNGLMPSGRTEIRPVNSNDHVRGNKSARIKIIEYSDFECPFCARLHSTLGRIVLEFPEDVQWVYRHFPLSQIHSQAHTAAMASECVAKLGGNNAFWEFSDTIFENQRSLGNQLYENTIQSIGLNDMAFKSCLSNEETAFLVDEDLQDAISSGGRGTPYSIIIGPSGEAFPINGALPYEQIVSLIRQLSEG